MIKPCVDCGIEIETRGPGKYCAPCRSARIKARDEAYRAKNREKYRRNTKRWSAANPEKVKARRDRERASGVARAREIAARERHAEERRIRAKEYYWKNRDRVLARLSSEEGRRYSRDRMRRAMQDPLRRLHSNISRSIRTALSGAKDGRSWEALVGYTRAELAVHLERQFVKGMGWHNMGEWEVDHIVPRCAFKFESADDPSFKACWAITNLRPLWSLENRAKSGNRLHLV